MTRRRSAAWTPGLLVTAVAAAHLLGCASLSGPGVTYVDYAHADQGATVITSGRDGSRTGAGLINGVSDSPTSGQRARAGRSRGNANDTSRAGQAGPPRTVFPEARHGRRSALTDRAESTA